MWPSFHLLLTSLHCQKRFKFSSRQMAVTKKWTKMKKSDNVGTFAHSTTTKKTGEGAQNIDEHNCLIQLRTHQWIQSTSYICTKRIFASLLLTFNKIFLKNLVIRFVVQTFMLLLVPLGKNWSIIRASVSPWNCWELTILSYSLQKRYKTSIS